MNNYERINQTDDQDEDKHEREDKRSLKVQVVRLQPRRQPISTPIQLTCPSELTDELDLELTQIEWIHETRIGNLTWSRKLWNSNERQTNRNLSLTELRGDSEKQNGRVRGKLMPTSDYSPNDIMETLSPISFATLNVIDYVTRAFRGRNDLLASKSNILRGDANIVDTSLDQVASKTRNDGQTRRVACENDNQRRTKFIRVVHLIAEPTDQRKSIETSILAKLGFSKDEPIEMLFMCRITNKVARLDFSQRILFDSSDSIETSRISNSSFSSSSSQAHVLNLTSAPVALESASADMASSEDKTGISSTNSNMERAKIRLVREMDSSTSSSSAPGDEPLLIPLNVPDWLLASSVGSPSTDVARRVALTAPAIGLNPHQRSATRHTVTNANLSSNSVASIIENHHPSITSIPTNHTQETSRIRLRSIAWNLIASYTDGSPNSPYNQIMEPESSTSLEVRPGKLKDIEHEQARDISENWLLKNLPISDASIWLKHLFGTFPLHVQGMVPLLVTIFLAFVIVLLVIKLTLWRARRGRCDRVANVVEKVESDGSDSSGTQRYNSCKKTDKSSTSQSPQSSIGHQMSSPSPWSLGGHDSIERGATYCAQRAEDAATTGGSGSSTTTGSQRRLIRAPYQHQHYQRDPAVFLDPTLLAAGSHDYTTSNWTEDKSLPMSQSFTIAQPYQTAHLNQLETQGLLMLNSTQPQRRGLASDIYQPSNLPSEISGQNMRLIQQAQYNNQHCWLPRGYKASITDRDSSHLMLVESPSLQTCQAKQAIHLKTATMNRYRGQTRHCVRPPMIPVHETDYHRCRTLNRSETLEPAIFSSLQAERRSMPGVLVEFGPSQSEGSTIESALDLLHTTIDGCLPK